MSYMVFISSLVAAWFIFELYLLWVNYKGRFKYGLAEANPLQRWIQEKIGVMALAVTLLFAFGIIWFAPFVISLLFNISHAVAFSSIASGMFGFRVVNVIVDRSTVGDFEKHCLKCGNKEECAKFLSEKCSKEYLKHTVKMAVEYTRETERESAPN